MYVCREVAALCERLAATLLPALEVPLACVDPHVCGEVLLRSERLAAAPGSPWKGRSPVWTLDPHVPGQGTFLRKCLAAALL